jgi:hypothetical protein
VNELSRDLVCHIPEEFIRARVRAFRWALGLGNVSLLLASVLASEALGLGRFVGPVVLILLAGIGLLHRAKATQPRPPYTATFQLGRRIDMTELRQILGRVAISQATADPSARTTCAVTRIFMSSPGQIVVLAAEGDDQEDVLTVTVNPLTPAHLDSDRVYRRTIRQLQGAAMRKG